MKAIPTQATLQSSQSPHHHHSEKKTLKPRVQGGYRQNEYGYKNIKVYGKMYKTNHHLSSLQLKTIQQITIIYHH